MRKVAQLVVSTSVVALITVLPAGLIFGPVHWWNGGVGFVTALPPAMATLYGTLWLLDRHRFGGLIAMAAGTTARAVVVLGLGLLVFQIARAQGVDALADPLRFWSWLMFAYLTTLALETALIAGSITRSSGGNLRE